MTGKPAQAPTGVPGKKLPFPATALNQHTLLLGKTRSGKSSKMRLFVEYFLDKAMPVTVIDPKGDWWGLKSSASGKEAGYPIIIFGSEWAKFADVRINARSGAEIGKLVATGNRPCIIDLKGMTVADRTQFFIDFADAYFRHAEGKRVLAIDEVHNFAPQGKVVDPKAGMALHWANRLISEGAGMGITMLSASQRPQKVHKDYATSHETLIACRAVHKLDRDASGDWVDACGDPAVKKELLGSLAGMKRDEAWVYSPEIEYGPKKISFPMFSTYDSFAPQESKTSTKLKGWAEIDLTEVEEKLAAVVQENKDNDPKRLKQKIADLQRQVASKQSVVLGKMAVEIESDAKVLQRPAVKQAIAAASAAAEQRGAARAHQTLLQRIKASLGRIVSGAAVTAIDELAGDAPAAPAPSRAIAERVVVATKVAPRATPPPRPALNGHDAATGDLSGPEIKALAALAWWASVGVDAPSKAQVCAIAGWRVTAGHIRNVSSQLKTKALIDYPKPGHLGLTPAGVSAAPAPEDRDRPVSQFVRDTLDGPQKQIFDELLRNPDGLSKEEICNALGWSPAAGHIRNVLSSMRSMEIVRYPAPGSARLVDWILQ